jgi:hypothetical protein
VEEAWRKMDYTTGFAVVTAVQLTLQAFWDVGLSRSVGRPAIPHISKNRSTFIFRVKQSKIFLRLLGDDDEDVTGTTRSATQCRIPDGS